MSAEPQAQGGPEIENLLAERRTFPPDPAFVAQANATAALYEEAEADYVGVLGAAGPASGCRGTRPFGETLEWDLPFAKWFSGGELNVAYNCVDRHVESGPRRQGRLPLDRRARRDPDDHLRDLHARELEGGERAARAGRAQGRPGRHLHADDPRAADRDARLRPDRRARTPSSSAASPRRRSAAASTTAARRSLITADGGWRRGKKVRSSRTPTRPSPTRRRSSTSWSSTASSDGASTMEPGRDVWWHDIVDRQSSVCPPVAVDSEHMLYLLYTSGTTAKPKGILHTSAGYLARHGVHALGRVRHQARRRLLVRGRHRLGDRATATSSTGRSPTRRPASCTRARPTRPTWDRWWQIVEDYKVTILYCAPTAIRAFMKQGEEYPGGARPVVAARPGLGRRADQPRGLALVPRGHRRRPRAGRRHLVADRDRPDHDHARCPA